MIDEDISRTYDVHLNGGSHDGAYIQVSQDIVNNGFVDMGKNINHSVLLLFFVFRWDFIYELMCGIERYEICQVYPDSTLPGYAKVVSDE